MQENWNNMELGREEKKKRRETNYWGILHNDSSSENISLTLTLYLRWEGQGKFGKEFIVLKFLLTGLGPETVFREFLSTNLEEIQDVHGETVEHRQRKMTHTYICFQQGNHKSDSQ